MSDFNFGSFFIWLSKFYLYLQSELRDIFKHFKSLKEVKIENSNRLVVSGAHQLLSLPCLCIFGRRGDCFQFHKKSAKACFVAFPYTYTICIVLIIL